jgi:uncharacterized LabA/DUF88 family protein
MRARSKSPAIAYVDGYNLYYGLRKSCGRGQPGWRWLDLEKLVSRLVPEYEIARIYYFTAYINPPTWAKATRQKRFLRALATLPEIEPVFGQYRSDPMELPLASDPDRTVEVLKTEEKQTDVNLAVRLIIDGVIEKTTEHLIVVSNDSDQVPPIKLLRERGLTVGVLNPHLDRPSAELKKVASWVRKVKPPNVLACQFADELEDDAGAFSKPPSW